MIPFKNCLFSSASPSKYKFIYCKIIFINHPMQLRGFIYWKFHNLTGIKPMVYMSLSRLGKKKRLHLESGCIASPMLCKCLFKWVVFLPQARELWVSFASVAHQTFGPGSWQFNPNIPGRKADTTLLLSRKGLALIPDFVSVGNSPIWEIVPPMFSYHEKHSAVISAA